MNKTLRTILLWALAVVVLIAIFYFLFRSPYSPITIRQEFTLSPAPEPETPMEIILWP